MQIKCPYCGVKIEIQESEFSTPEMSYECDAVIDTFACNNCLRPFEIETWIKVRRTIRKINTGEWDKNQSALFV